MMTCRKCQHGTAKRFGFTKSKNQRYRCRDCGATFTDSPEKPLGRHTTDLDRATMAFTLLTEGMSVRAVSRVTGLHKGTILSLLGTVAEKSRAIFDRYVQDVAPAYVQADEIWTFIHTKEKRVKPSDPREYGDAYVWIALDSETKTVLSYYVGRRDGLSGYEFIQDLGDRIREQHRFQFTSDGHEVYPGAIEERFGADIDFAQLIKNYSTPRTDGPDWFRPSARVVSTTPKFISGSPKISRISTSHIERANLTVRMQLRRFTRLTNGFSKKLANLKAMVDVFFVWYNFCRVHQTLRMTPAMEAGWTDHVWTLRELLTADTEEGSRPVALTTRH